MDALSSVLKAVRLEGAVYLNAEFSAPWCIRGRFGHAAIRGRLGGAEHLLYFHFLTEGACRVRLVDGTEVLDLSAGDVVLFPQDDRHLMGSDLNRAPVDTETIPPVQATADMDLIQIRLGGGGAVTRFVCGYLGCGPGAYRPLLEGLPRLLHIPLGESRAATLVRELLRVGVRESVDESPGAESMLAKVAELLFVQAIRTYVESLPPGGTGWLAAARDRVVGRAMALLHASPAEDWSVEALAAKAGASRSVLAERFVSLMGQPPMAYLARCRLQRAARILQTTQRSIVQTALEVGYESEAAFNRAFKRGFGLPPAQYRRRLATSGTDQHGQVRTRTDIRSSTRRSAASAVRVRPWSTVCS